MQVVILAGGMGTRISEETAVRPKPMIEIGGRPILWHIMKLYAHHGLTDFVICLGYKGYMIKEYFMNFVLHHSDVTIDAAKNSVTYHQSSAEPWRITLVDTGEATLPVGASRGYATISIRASRSASPMATVFPISTSAPQSSFIAATEKWRR